MTVTGPAGAATIPRMEPTPMHITNTTDDPNTPFAVIAEAITVGITASIEAMEARGQTQLVNSDRLPVDTRGRDADFLALGFTFGDPDPNDPLFRPATLPSGWTRQRSEHPMWSHIVDETGRKRVAVFYKAAFYDRKADMTLERIDGESPDGR